MKSKQKITDLWQKYGWYVTFNKQEILLSKGDLRLVFELDTKKYYTYEEYVDSPVDIDVETHKLISGTMKLLGWLR